MQDQIDAMRAKEISPRELLIAGQLRPARSGAVLEVLSPLNGKHLTTIADAGKEDVEAACLSARAAFDSGVWSRAAPAHRKKVLLQLADLIERDALKLAVLGVRDNGTEISMALKAEPMSAASTFRYYAELIDKVYGEIAPSQSDVLALVHKQAVGVVAAIVPWNFPLMIGAWKIAPALAAGNSVVLKPAETASLSLLRIAELALEAGVPPGVFNVVTGRGPVAGEALGLSMHVDVLAFTGSGGVGRKLLEYSARSNLKRVYLELGGKSPNIVFADAPDLEKAAKVAAYGIFRNSGQVCIAGSRLLVEAPIADEFAAKVAKIAATMKVGDPLDLTTEAGAINSEAQLSRSLGFTSRATTEGAELLTGGSRILQETGGWFMAPTVLSKVRPDMEVARNEVFGPVLAVMPFDDEAAAIRIANDTEFGLASAVWTSNFSRAHRMVQAVRAGVVHVNTYGGSDLTVPLGGVKQSGNGHDKSPHALDKYLDLKTAWIQL
ncbi:aldehyde dehydrogenase [Rhizobium lentis]|uniref:aldehyde dehydrogenase n=1 Tax=Rhizobium lentis TaxID=1138194 RepID=UPI001C82DB85|nr:aldehyde dehydrogenase [Rhizobium lentis]MBX5041300.1 aldehyde dehydrogenase [Rhizobium lentis]MBX5071556.1 aldehyde dehydrogenase [Rhizobium lentis]MBX5108406.1 aldehyde dehydrogenase [Rhizobium lentis]MBX5117358.1 aldehyde dehydrogenase [Rhizobium lentis]